MKYFSPETSQKLEEIGLKASPIGWIASAEGAMDAIAISQKTLHTLDICEIENAKKLWGETLVSTDIQLGVQKTWHLYQRAFKYETRLEEYITLSDEERVKYVEDYLNMV